MWKVKYKVVKRLDGLGFYIVKEDLLLPFFFGGKIVKTEILEKRFLTKFRAIEYVKVLKVL